MKSVQIHEEVFCVNTYLNAKAIVINDFLKKVGISQVIISNDSVCSVIAAAIILQAAQASDSTIENVLLVGKYAVVRYHNSGSGHFVKNSILKECRREVLPEFPLDPFVAALKCNESGYRSIVCGRTDYLPNGMVNFWGSDGQGLSDLQLFTDISLPSLMKLGSHFQIELCEPELKVSTTATMSNIYRQRYLDYLEQLLSLHDISFPRSGHAIHLIVKATNIPGQYGYVRSPPPPTIKALQTMQALQLPMPPLSGEAIDVHATLLQYDKDASVRYLENLFSNSELGILMDFLQRCTWRGSDIHGKPVISMNHEGSSRSSIYSSVFAQALWERLQRFIPATEVFHPTHALTDTQGCQVWYPIGISPLLRFMKYDSDKGLVVHYDAPYVESEDVSTLYTVVIYLNDNDSGGTRFYNDRQRLIPHSERDYSDQKTSGELVLKEFSPRAGHAIIFPHRLLHDSAPLVDGSKVILRTDILFRKACCVRDSPLLAHIREVPDVMGTRILERQYLSARVRYNEEELIEAGYIHVRRQEPVETNWLSTPFEKAARTIDGLSCEQKQQPLVLFNTGCYNPPHQGHIHILQQAKFELEKRGRVVVGGYLVPAHQTYIEDKVKDCPGRGASLDAAERVAACGKAINDNKLASEWVDVDPYEALYGKCDVNFTTTHHRLEAYLRHHLGDQIHLVYVFGGDNAAFSRVYWNQGLAVCVNRPEHEETFRRFRSEIESPEFAGFEDRKKRILWVDGNHQLASSSIRKESISNGTQPLQLGESATPPLAEHIWHLRSDSDDHFLFTLSLAALVETSIPSSKVCITEVRDQEAFLRAKVEEIHNSLRSQRLGEQDTQLIETISLDALVPGQHNLAISRLYSLCDIAKATMFSTPTMVARPGNAEIPIQLSKIPFGPAAPRYLLFDDDIHTGTTMRYVTNLLTRPQGSPNAKSGPKREIISTLSLTSTTPRPLDIADARDFLLGAPHGGLVVTLPTGQLVRAPYILPYVSPNARSSIPLKKQYEFSREVWALNLIHYDYVKGHNGQTHVRVKDIDFAAAALLRYLGFRDEDDMVLVCNWHLRRFV